MLLSGQNDWGLFIRNDILLDNDRIIFVFGFIFLFGLSIIICSRILLVPRYDDVTRIALIVFGLFVVYGLILSFLRISLWSRSVYLVEYLLISGLLISIFSLQHRMLPRVLGLLTDDLLPQFIEHRRIDWVLVKPDLFDYLMLDGLVTTLTESRDASKTIFLSELANSGIPLLDKDSLLEALTGKLALEGLSHITLDKMRPKNNIIFLKRAIDLVIIVLLTPFFLILALAIGLFIKIDSKGPIFFRQERVGYHGQSFLLIKFRSMYIGSEDNGQTFARKDDARVTRVGRLLRRSRLDEMPQIWNVLKGEMSIVGPRPEQKYFVDKFSLSVPFYGFRHMVRPGITGWAQIMYGYTADEYETKQKVAYDLFYLKNMSLWLDVVILAKTIQIIILGSGSR